jgi:hypothetical protein
MVVRHLIVQAAEQVLPIAMTRYMVVVLARLGTLSGHHEAIESLVGWFSSRLNSFSCRSFKEPLIAKSDSLTKFIVERQDMQNMPIFRLAS